MILNFKGKREGIENELLILNNCGSIFKNHIFTSDILFVAISHALKNMADCLSITFNQAILPVDETKKRPIIMP